jgi:hypothetical protein
MPTNNIDVHLGETLSYTFVSFQTLEYVFPVSSTQTYQHDLEDQLDNIDADKSLKEARAKGTKSWSNLKKELSL